ncbi:hypothetical protein [Pontibacter indicus]|uniref:Uncharacterized protein n=1 Tax=Pontibacter indicus TaxID=1317125 RepID=A0A1R3XNT6_9BACT|nr:hypothetical protein [Pontibacter indicus]SIT93610.1 hypothetical protein SAMN05444128_3104 [Pontibacter indicus]
MFKKTLAGMFGLLLSLASCQSPDNAQTEQPAAQEITAAADTTKREPRPKPDYYNFRGVERKRVYICMDATEDTFHQKHDCPELITCKGQFRNLILARAIEDFDRYNCETCSANLAYIFDETYVP